MNIAIINAIAKTGSTGKIAYGFQRYLKSQGHNAYLFYGRDDEKVSRDEKDIIRIGNNVDRVIHCIKTRITGLQGVYSKASTRKMLAEFDTLGIQAVCMFNLHGYYLNFPMLFRYLGLKKIPCEYVMLDEYPFLGKCAYSFECNKFMTECKQCPRLRDYPKSVLLDGSSKMFRLKQRSYSLVPQCIFVGIEYTVERAKQSAITRGCQFAIADEAVDIQNQFFPRDTKRLRAELNIPNTNKIIVTVAPYPDERKGGKYFLEAARRLVNHKDITFVHVGFSSDTRECPPNYIPIGYVKDQDLLCEYYSLGDLFVHTSTAETIPSAIIEALACGTHILGFNISGIPFSSDSEHGTFVDPFNVDQMVDIILKTPRKNESRINSCRKYAESRYDSFDYGRKLLSYLEK